MFHTRSGSAQAAEEAFRQHGGLLKTLQALELRIHPRTLYALRDAGIIEPLSRGVYRLTGLPPIGNPDLVRVALRVLSGVICLISALAFHDLTKQVPHEVHMALERGAEPPWVDYPPIKVYWFTGAAFVEGVEHHTVDDVPMQTCSVEKTIADCFKYRNKLGLDIAIEVLKRYREHGKLDLEALQRSAHACHVENVMSPYSEALL